jgi:hypothetical protein
LESSTLHGKTPGRGERARGSDSVLIYVFSVG